jgi:hypothetical protein
MNSSLQSLQRELLTVVSDLNRDETQWRPAKRPSAWSVQQIVEHLLLTYSSTEATLEARLAKATPTRKPPTLMQRTAQLFVIRFGYFPSGIQAPEPVRPERSDAARCGAELCAEISLALESLDELTQRCTQVLGTGRAVTHFVLGPLDMHQWTKFHLVHGRHHIKQIRAIRREHRG